jgi:hypothetical protein
LQEVGFGVSAFVTFGCGFCCCGEINEKKAQKNEKKSKLCTVCCANILPGFFSSKHVVHVLSFEFERFGQFVFNVENVGARLAEETKLAIGTAFHQQDIRTAWTEVHHISGVPRQKGFCGCCLCCWFLFFFFLPSPTGGAERAKSGRKEELGTVFFFLKFPPKKKEDKPPKQTERPKASTDTQRERER